MILTKNNFKNKIRFFLLALALAAFTPEAHAQIFPDTSSETQEEEEPEFAEDSLGRRTPRGTVMGFIREVSARNYSRASGYLNLDPSVEKDHKGEDLVKVLQKLLDRGGNMLPYNWISNENQGLLDDDLPAGLDRIGSVTADRKTIDLYVEKTQDINGGPVWLFSSETVGNIANVTLEEPVLIERLLPDFLKDNVWGGVPVGQWLAALLLAGMAYLFAWILISLIKYLLARYWKKAGTEPTAGVIAALSLPFKISLGVWFYIILTRNMGISIIVRQWFSGIVVVLLMIAFLLLLWRFTDFIGDFSKRKMSRRGNLSGVSAILFLKRAAKVAIFIFGIIAILDTVGVDVTAGLAALGIGGLALALGAQKTLENFVGSVTLIADQPIRVGDFCKVGDIVGTVEQIGMRSTRIRTLNRTLVTIPNGNFSSENIENYAHRDRFLFNPTLDLRYETSPDQIRFLLVEIRSLLYSHPMVNPEPARIRFVELGANSLKLEIFSYIDSPNFDRFLEVKEDLLLRIMDIVAESGSDFAFPSQTIYFGKDQGLSREKGGKAEETVKKWKEANDLQIPAFDPERIKNLKDSLPYPPEGSVGKRDQGEELF